MTPSGLGVNTESSWHLMGYNPLSQMGKQGLEVRIQVSADLRLAAAVYSLPFFPRNNNREKFFPKFCVSGRYFVSSEQTSASVPVQSL